MGTDKPRLLIGNESFVQRIGGQLSEGHSQGFCGGKMDSPISSFPFVPDVHERWGALGGVHAAACRLRGRVGPRSRLRFDLT